MAAPAKQTASYEPFGKIFTKILDPLRADESTAILCYADRVNHFFDSDVDRIGEIVKGNYQGVVAGMVEAGFLRRHEAIPGPRYVVSRLGSTSYALASRLSSLLITSEPLNLGVTDEELKILTDMIDRFVRIGAEVIRVPKPSLH